jgi:hypothetical protein
MIKDLIIRILFRLLGNEHQDLYSIGYLFGENKDLDFKARQNRWNNALARVWKNKNFLDFLYYQAETDKEKYWKGKVGKDYIQGARIRTLYIVYSAQKAYKEIQKQNKKTTGERLKQVNKQMVDDNANYKKTVDIS